MRLSQMALSSSLASVALKALFKSSGILINPFPTQMQSAVLLLVLYYGLQMFTGHHAWSQSNWSFFCWVIHQKCHFYQNNAHGNSRKVMTLAGSTRAIDILNI